jgi:hypothetical protein
MLEKHVLFGGFLQGESYRVDVDRGEGGKAKVLVSHESRKTAGKGYLLISCNSWANRRTVWTFRCHAIHVAQKIGHMR